MEYLERPEKRWWKSTARYAMCEKYKSLCNVYNSITHHASIDRLKINRVGFFWNYGILMCIFVYRTFVLTLLVILIMKNVCIQYMYASFKFFFNLLNNKNDDKIKITIQHLYHQHWYAF